MPDLFAKVSVRRRDPKLPHMWKAPTHPLREAHAPGIAGTTYVFVQDTMPASMRAAYKFSMSQTVPPGRDAAIASGMFNVCQSLTLTL